MEEKIERDGFLPRARKRIGTGIVRCQSFSQRPETPPKPNCEFVVRQSARLCVATFCLLSPGPANRHAPEQSQNHPLRPDRQSRCDQAIMRSSASQSGPGGGATEKSHLTKIEQYNDCATVTRISRGGASPPEACPFPPQLFSFLAVEE